MFVGAAAQAGQIKGSGLNPINQRGMSSSGHHTVSYTLPQLINFNYSEGSNSSTIFQTFNLREIAMLNPGLFRNVFSTGKTCVEVKYGSMVFDSSLVIISCNYDPRDMAQACGLDSRDPMYRRLTDTCGAHEIATKAAARCRLPVHLLRVIKHNLSQFGIDIDVDNVIRNIPNFHALVYSDIPKFSNCHLSEFI